jgi:hypothetical protein
MILPEKHIRLAESLLALGGFVLASISRPKGLDTIWREFQEVCVTEKFPAYHSFENLILAVDFLFCIGAVCLTDDGKLSLCA